MKVYSLLCLSLLFALLLLSSVSAENWPRFRGPNGQGLGSGSDFPAKWASEHQAWQIELDGKGHSSPVVWGDKVFVTFVDQDKSSGTLLAARCSDGTVLWQKSYPLRFMKMNKLNSLAGATPVVDAGRVYVIWYGSDQTLVVALDHEGEAVWTCALDPNPQRHGPCASPMLYQDLVIFTLERPKNEEGRYGVWIALDGRNGKTRWQIKREGIVRGSYSTPCVYRTKAGRDQIVFSSFDFGLVGVEPLTGDILWEVKDAHPARVVSSPVLAGDLVLSTCGGGGAGKLVTAVRPAEGEGSAKTVYTLTKAQAPYVPTPVAIGSLLFTYHDSGTVSCLDAATGTVHWSEKPGGKFYGSPVCVGDKLFCIDRAGDVVVLKAAKQYQHLATHALGELSHATPAFADGRMFLRTVSKLICIQSNP